jgi:hypothetical protein
MSVEFELTATDVSLEADQILEKQDDIIGKILVDIAKLVVSDTNRCRPYWTVATLMHPTSQSDLTSAPAMLWSSGGETSRQGWVWDRGDDVYDVFVLRSVEDKQTEVSFSLADANPGFPSLNLSLPKGLSYGFARVAPEAGAWVVEPDYLVGLMEGSSDKKPNGKAEVLPATANAQRESYGLSNVFPNPATSVSTFTLQVPLAETITVDVYDVTGRRVSLVHDGVLAAGTPYEFRIDTSNWAPGLYVIRARGEFTNQTRTLLRSN